MTSERTQHGFLVNTEQLLALVGRLTGRRLDRPTPGRWDRYVRAAISRLVHPEPVPWRESPRELADGDLNPQPLPPRARFFDALANEVIGRAVLLQELTAAMPSVDVEENGIIIVGGFLSQFADEYCGNGFVVGWPYPGPPPQWLVGEVDSVDLLVIGQQMAVGAAEAFGESLRESLANAARKFAEVGLFRMQQQSESRASAGAA